MIYVNMLTNIKTRCKKWGKMDFLDKSCNPNDLDDPDEHDDPDDIDQLTMMEVI